MTINPLLYQTFAAPQVPTPNLGNASVLELILRRVRVRSQRRVAWLTHLWGQSSTEMGNGYGGALPTGLD